MFDFRTTKKEFVNEQYLAWWFLFWKIVDIDLISLIKEHTNNQILLVCVLVDFIFQ